MGVLRVSRPFLDYPEEELAPNILRKPDGAVVTFPMPMGIRDSQPGVQGRVHSEGEARHLHALRTVGDSICVFAFPSPH